MTDWRLPTVEELELMYQLHINERGNFRSNVYWSSTEYNSNSAIYFNFLTGAIYNSGKGDSSSVRFVREFQSNTSYDVGKETDTGVIVKVIKNPKGMNFLYTYIECSLKDNYKSITWYDAMRININEYDVVYQFLLKNGANKLVFECLDKLALSYTEG